MIYFIAKKKTLHLQRFTVMENLNISPKNTSEIDKKILLLYAENKEMGFHLLYNTYYLPLCIYSIKISNSIEDSKDIVQNFFINFWVNDVHLRIKGELHNYLYGAIYKATLRKLEEKRFLPLEDMEEVSYSPIDEHYDEEDIRQKHRMLQAAIDNLPAKERECIYKIIYDRKSYQETADELGLSINTVKTHMQRAIKQLRRSGLDTWLFLFYSIL